MGSTAEHPQTQIVSLPYSSSFPYTGTYCIKQHSELLPQKKTLKRMKKRNEQNGFESNTFFIKKNSHLVARSKKQLPELHAF